MIHTGMDSAKTICTEMVCTGTFLEGLIASVARAEMRSVDMRAADEMFAAETTIVEAIVAFPETIEPWLVSAVESPEFDSKLLGVA